MLKFSTFLEVSDLKLMMHLNYFLTVKVFLIDEKNDALKHTN